jgi:cytochrome c peroxidase
MRSAPRPSSKRVLVGGAVAVSLALGSLAVAEESGEPPAAFRQSLRELGRRIFFDPAASSRMGMRSCADCHHPHHGFSDPEKTSADDTGPTRRHSQTLVDNVNNVSSHWDGEFQSVHELVGSRMQVTFDATGSPSYGRGGRGSRVTVERLRAMQELRRASSPSTPGLPGTSESPGFGEHDGSPFATRLEDGTAAFLPDGLVLSRDPRAAPAFVDAAAARLEMPDAAGALQVSGRYREAFRAAYGSEGVTLLRVSEAVQEFCHSIRSGVSPYDRHAAGEENALSPSARRGLDLFRGRAGCVACHSMGEGRSTFTDASFHDTGISWRGAGLDGRRRTRVEDIGRGEQTRRAEDARAFKTPTLRDVARHPPYMHDGSLATLEDVVRHYASEPPADPNLDSAFPRFTATDEDVADLVAFLRSLTSDERPGRATVRWAERVARTRLGFVDAEGRPLGSLRVALVPAGDVLPGFAEDESAPRLLTTDPEGGLAFSPGHTTHTRIVLPDGLYPRGGDLVPDTCNKARIVLPIRGRASLVVAFPSEWRPPEEVVASHRDATVFPGRRRPTTLLRRRSVETAVDGSVEATYDGPFRLDAGGQAEVRLSTPDGGTLTLPVHLDPTAAALLSIP